MAPSSTPLFGAGAGGGLSLCLSAASSCGSASASSSVALRSVRDSRRLGSRLSLAGGNQTRRQKCSMFRCASDVDVVTEDGKVYGEDETADPAAAGDGDADVDTKGDEAAPPVKWIKRQRLPYPSHALEPYISKETVRQHWGVHQQMHVDRLNGMIGGSEWEGMSLAQIMMSSFNEGRERPHPPFFHAAQIWNHDFYWRSMQRRGGGKPPERLLKFINRDFGSYDGMIRQFMDAALTQFGSGWVWLSYKRSKLPHVKSKSPIPSERYGRLVITKTPNAINPLFWGHSPLLAIDVWEHAYYLDYEDRRADYVSAFLKKLVSWRMVDLRLEKAIARALARDGPITRRQIRQKLLDQVRARRRARRKSAAVASAAQKAGRKIKSPAAVASAAQKARRKIKSLAAVASAAQQARREIKSPAAVVASAAQKTKKENQEAASGSLSRAEGEKENQEVASSSR